MRAFTDMTGSMPGIRRQTDRWKNAIHQNADADHVKVRVRQIEETAAVAGMAQLHGDAARGQSLEDFVETGELEIGERLVCFIGLCEVGHHAFERERFLGADLFDERQRLVPAHAEAAHAGVDFHMHRHTFVGGRGGAGEFADGMRFIDADGQIVFHAPRQFGFLPFAQQQQRRGDAGVAERHRFFQGAEAKPPGAFFERDARHVERAMSVGLVLGDGQQLHVVRQIAADELQIAAQPGEVNFNPSRAQWKTG